jgi:CheY-like chemotaxis protein
MDKAQINQVIQNLVVNADQSMANGGVVSISCDNAVIAAEQVPGLEQGRYVRVSVRDSGIGITKDNIGRIFDPYFSTKGKNSTKGSGLGLSIVRSIIIKHGGNIMVDSSPGEGSTFTLYLPAMAEENFAKAAGTAIADSKGRILVMDDEEIIRDVTCKMLSHLGYESERSSDGDEAITLYEDNFRRGRRFDAVIMDLTIPGGMGGQEAVTRLLELDPQAKVIVSSGYSHDPILVNFGSYGFCNIVSKPYQLHELSRVLADTLAG